MRILQWICLVGVGLVAACGPETVPPATVAVADVAGDSAADAATDADAGADTAVDATSDVAADTLADVAPEVAADTAIDTDVDTDVDTAADTAADTASCDAAAAKFFGCPTNAMAFPWCLCTAKGLECMDHPEYGCPQTCIPGQKLDMPCPDGSTAPMCTCKAPPCQPICQTAADGSTAWLNPCTGAKKPAACKGCALACSPGWSSPQAWLDGCTGGELWQDSCDANWDCSGAATCKTTSCKAGAEASYTCKAGETPQFCQCAPSNGPCQPTCGYDSAGQEGWVDSCSKAMIKLGKCMGCNANCDKIGSKSEGWYSDCTGLITWANCATGQWKCDPEPWKKCVAIKLCKKAGEGWTEPGEIGQCCPGTVARDEVGWDGKTCQPLKCMCKVCLACGDGKCDGKENPCNCPEDCGKP